MKPRILLILVAAVLVAGCKGKSNNDYEFVNNKSNSSADSVGIADTSQIIPKLVKTAEIDFKVKNVQQISESIALLVKQYGGMTMHHKVQSISGQTKDVHISNDSIMRIAAFNTSGEMTVKVPFDKLDDFMTKVGHMGIYVNTSNMDIEDKSLDYLSNRLKLKERQELLSQQKQGKIKIKNPADVLLLKDDMVDAQIGNLKTEYAVKYSVLNLNFYQSDSIIKEIIANDDPSGYDIPFTQRLGLALSSGWNIFVDVVIGAANLWVFILTGIVAWRLYSYYKKRTNLTNHPAA